MGWPFAVLVERRICRRGDVRARIKIRIVRIAGSRQHYVMRQFVTVKPTNIEMREHGAAAAEQVQHRQRTATGTATWSEILTLSEH